MGLMDWWSKIGWGRNSKQQQTPQPIGVSNGVPIYADDSTPPTAAPPSSGFPPPPTPPPIIPVVKPPPSATDDQRGAWEQVGGALGVLDAMRKTSGQLWGSFSTGKPPEKDLDYYYPNRSQKPDAAQPSTTAVAGAQSGQAAGTQAGQAAGAATDRPPSPWAAGAQVQSISPYGGSMSRTATARELDLAGSIRAEVDADPETASLSEEEKAEIVQQRTYEAEQDRAARGETLKDGQIVRQGRQLGVEEGGMSLASPELQKMAEEYYKEGGKPVARAVEYRNARGGYGRAVSSGAYGRQVSAEEIEERRAFRDKRAAEWVERAREHDGATARMMGLKSKALQQFNPIKQDNPDVAPILDEDAAQASAFQSAEKSAGWSFTDKVAYNMGPNTRAGRVAYAKREKMERQVERNLEGIRRNYEAQLAAFTKKQENDLARAGYEKEVAVAALNALKDPNSQLSKEAREVGMPWIKDFSLRKQYKIDGKVATLRDHLVAFEGLEPGIVKRFEEEFLNRFAVERLKNKEDVTKLEAALDKYVGDWMQAEYKKLQKAE